MKKLLLLLLTLAGCNEEPKFGMRQICNSSARQQTFLLCVEKATSPEFNGSVGKEAEKIVYSCASAAEDIHCSPQWVCVIRCDLLPKDGGI